MPTIVSNLLRESGGLTTCSPDESASTVLSRMEFADYSQLPVVDADRSLLGMVNRDSILAYLLSFGGEITEICARDCMDSRPATRRYNEDVTEILRDLETRSAVIIVNEDGYPAGIVTDYDTALYFRLKSEKLIILEDIELTLRSLLQAPFLDDSSKLQEIVIASRHSSSGVQLLIKALNMYTNLAEVKGPVDKELAQEVYRKTFGVDTAASNLTNLSLGELINVFLSKDISMRLEKEVSMPKEHLRKMLESVRDTRNKLLHFRGEVSGEETKMLERCRDWLQSTLSRVESSFVAKQEDIDSQISKSEQSIKEAVLEARRNPESHPNDESRGLVVKRDLTRRPALPKWLAGIPEEVSTTYIRFSMLEELLDTILPPSAFEHRSWWTNDPDTQVLAPLWLQSGWVLESVNFGREQVRFRRTRVDEEPTV